MVNYHLPWNPNRIEQRFGRIHRIGQTEVCHLWNLVAHTTREGAVFMRLLDKIEEQRKTVYDAAGISRKTALSYDTLLRDLTVVNELPAWATNRLKRLSRASKRYMVDSGLLGGILRIGVDDVMASGDLLRTMIETFVIAELAAQAAVSTTRYRLSHLRDRDGRREVDVIAELGGGRVVGVEIKAAASVGPSDARHLSWLGETMQERFAGGVVLHTGRDTFELGDRILAVPISALWA